MRTSSKLIGTLTVVVITAAGGCMSPWSPVSSAASSVSVVQDAVSVSPATPLATTDVAESLEPNAGGPQTREEAKAAVHEKLQEIGTVDLVAKQKLLAELEGAKPEDWPRMVQQFQSALAFREQLAAKESQTAEVPKTSPEVTQVASVYVSKENGATKASLPASEMAAIHQGHLLQQVASSMAGVASESREARSELAVLGKTQPLPLPSTNSSNDRKLTAVASKNLGPGERQVVEQTSMEAPAGSSQEYLQAAITSMEQSTATPPASVDDVQQHMRLRLLRLLAGQESGAVSPIPGASRPQQDYWSNQLFAISTYLDNQQQPDVKRRASGSLIHLDSARASLAELATLQVRNLTFVDSVEGFGVYQEHEETKFRPGDQVTLYTEVENFRSESTKEGYQTRLSTSYEVLDRNGTRVDGAQFPDVEDLCKNQRRDFHMQYGVALPTKIYAGHYQLQLTITDQLSHKIGQTSVEFEIIE